MSDPERQRAFRALLMRPLLTARHPDFPLVRKHSEWIREWAWRNAGWSFHLDSEFARLRKVPADLGDGTRPAAGFDRRRYVLLCLALAVLGRADRQITLGRVAEGIVHLAAEISFPFELQGRDQRRELVQVMRFLLDLGVLHRVDGDEQHYVAEAGDVLYNVNRPILAAVPAFRRGPSTLEADSLEAFLEALAEEPSSDTDEGRNRLLRTALTRRLLDDPVVYHDRLSEDERAYLVSQRPHLVRQVEEATGLVDEARAEGLAMVDPAGDLTDLGMPEEGTDGHAALLLAEFLAERARREPGVPVGPATLHQKMADLVAEFKPWWRKAVAEPGGERLLADDTVRRLAALGLVQPTPEGIVPLPALGRFALGEPVAPPLEDPLIEGLSR